MKKSIVFILTIVFLLIGSHVLAEANFSSNPDSVEEAAKSVLMLEVFNSDNQVIATGSGFVAFNNRTLITNYHVIEGADWLMATSDSGYQYIVNKILITDKEKDIAICCFMSPTDILPLELNIDGELKRAQRIVAIGSPIGITNTVSLGNISALYDDHSTSIIQFTAPISHGSSGGALFDDHGTVIGVTSGFYEETQNLNVAVHISEVNELYQSWKEKNASFDDYFVSSVTPEVTVIPTPKPVSTPTATPLPHVTPQPTPIAKYKMLMLGDKGDIVKKLQQRLIELGFLSGKADGVYGQKTAAAIESFNKQHGLNWGPFAMNDTQIILFEGEAQSYKDPAIILRFKENSSAESKPISGDQLQVRFQLTNSGKIKTVTSFDLHAYAVDMWGNKLYGLVQGIVRYETTEKKITPGKSAYSNYITLPKRSEISRIYCGIRKIIYSDGSVCIIPHSEIEYTCWNYKRN